VKSIAGAQHAHHLFPIHVPPRLRDEVLSALNEQGIGCTVNYRSVPTLTYYREKYGYDADDFPVAYEWGEGTISLPLFPSMTTEEQAHVIDAVRELVAPAVGA